MQNIDCLFFYCGDSFRKSCILMNRTVIDYWSVGYDCLFVFQVVGATAAKASVGQIQNITQHPPVPCCHPCAAIWERLWTTTPPTCSFQPRWSRSMYAAPCRYCVCVCVYLCLDSRFWWFCCELHEKMFCRVTTKKTWVSYIFVSHVIFFHFALLFLIILIIIVLILF